MPWVKIKNDDELEKASARLNEIWSVKSGDPDYAERKLLVALIVAYEDEHVHIPPPDPVVAIKFRMEHGGLSEKDLVPYIGSLPDVYAVLAGQKLLSSEIIERLHTGLGIPLKSLIPSKSSTVAIMSNRARREKIIVLAAKVDRYRKALKVAEAELDAELSDGEDKEADISIKTVTQKPKRAAQDSLPTRIMARFNSDPNKVFEFSELRDLTDIIPTLRSTLSRLVAKGKLRKEGFGKYRLKRTA
jgi:HTH-type transcriptional regulator/antitoxin HigA